MGSSRNMSPFWFVYVFIVILPIGFIYEWMSGALGLAFIGR